MSETTPPAECHEAQEKPPARLVQWLAISPLLAWLVAFVAAPTAILLLYSFCQRDELGQIVHTFTLDNYRRVFENMSWLVLLQAALAAAATAVALAGAGWGWSLTVHGEKPSASSQSRLLRLGALIGAGAWLHYSILHAQAGGIYPRIFLRSVELAALTTVICLIVGFPVAYTIGRAAPRWRITLIMAVMIPFWTSFLIRTYAWLMILRKEGLLNSALLYMKLIPTIFPQPVELLYTPTAVVIGLVYTYLPFMILPIYASVEKISPSLIEAALDLGARPVALFRSVILPLSLPGMAAGVALVFVPAIGMFAVTDLMGGARTLLIGNVIQNQFGQARDWPFGSALGIVLLALFVMALWVWVRILRHGTSPENESQPYRLHD